MIQLLGRHQDAVQNKNQFIGAHLIPVAGFLASTTRAARLLLGLYPFPLAGDSFAPLWV